jgi:hypothetical protein
MQLPKNRFRGFYLCFVLLLILVTGGSAIAYADSGSATVAIRGGSLTESNATNQVSVQVNKKVKSILYSLLITAIDARGSGGGWNLTITSTRFIITNDKNSNQKQLPANASHITGVNLLCGVHSTCTKPVNRLSYPLLVPADNTPPPAVKFFDAAVRSGLGKFFLTMMVNVDIPANTEAGTYTSTIILAIANGP